jgi:hypothetical protein
MNNFIQLTWSWPLKAHKSSIKNEILQFAMTFYVFILMYVKSSNDNPCLNWPGLPLRKHNYNNNKKISSFVMLWTITQTWRIFKTTFLSNYLFCYNFNFGCVYSQLLKWSTKCPWDGRKMKFFKFQDQLEQGTKIWNACKKNVNIFL